MPEEQNPHCAALRAMNSLCSCESFPLSERPSMVSTDLPEICAASVRQPRAVRPSIMTVHAPQMPCSQPRWVPVSSMSWRRKSARCWRAFTRRSAACRSKSLRSRRLPPRGGWSWGHLLRQRVEHAAREHCRHVELGVGAQSRRILRCQVLPDRLLKGGRIRQRRRKPRHRGRNGARDFGVVDAPEIRKPRRAYPIAPHGRQRGQANQGKIALAARQLGESHGHSRSHGWKFDGDNQLTGLEFSLEQALEEILRLHLAFAEDAAERKRRAERHGAGG